MVARELELGERMSQRAVSVPQEELDRLSGNRNVLAALLEAALGAVFLEYGFEQIEDSVVGAFAGRIEYARTTYVDHKTELQERSPGSGARWCTRCWTSPARRTTGCSPVRP